MINFLSLFIGKLKCFRQKNKSLTIAYYYNSQGRFINRITAVPPWFMVFPHSLRNTNIFPAIYVCPTSWNTKLNKLFTMPSVVHLMNCISTRLSAPLALCKRIFHFYLHVNGLSFINFLTFYSCFFFLSILFYKKFFQTKQSHFMYKLPSLWYTFIINHIRWLRNCNILCESNVKETRHRRHAFAAFSS